MSRQIVDKVVTELQKLGKLGPTRKKGPRNLGFDCPFHSPGKRQDTPSFGIHVETGEWNCFNPMCGRKGPSIQALFSVLTGIPQEEAAIAFPKDFGATDELRQRLSGATKIEVPQALAPYPLTAHIGAYPEAAAYMASRNIPEDVWNKMGLVYCPDPRMLADISMKATMGGKRIVFPIRLPDGRLGFMGRSIGNDPVPKWRPIENTGLFFYDPLRLIGSTWRIVILVEGEFDVAACIREGLPVIGCFGARLGAERAHLLQQFDKILVFFDGDSAGLEGAARAISDGGDALKGRIVPFCAPPGMDPAKLAPGFGMKVLAHAEKRSSFSDDLRRRLHVARI